MAKKILIIGASGTIGKGLLALSSESQKFYKNFIPIPTFSSRNLQYLNSIYLNLNEANFEQNLDFLTKDDVVVLLAAVSNPKLVREDVSHSYYINVVQTKIILEKCAAKKCKVIFLSSVEVFDGLNAPYDEQSRPNPLNEYGKQKFEIEEFIQKKFDTSHFKIVRIPWNVSMEPTAHCPVSAMYKLLETGKAKVAKDYLSSSIFTMDTAKLIMLLAANFQNIPDQIIHFSGSEYFSRLDLVNFIKNRSIKLSTAEFEIVNFRSLDLVENRAIDTRLNNQLSISLFDYKYENIWDVIDRKIEILDIL